MQKARSWADERRCGDFHGGHDISCETQLLEVRCGCHSRLIWQEKLPSDLDSVVDSTRSMVFDVISSEKRRENCVCARSDVQVQGRANGQSGSEMGPWNLGWQGANDRRAHHSHGQWVQKARSLHRVPPEERFVISELKKSARISLERVGGELESDDCDATGPRFIWTSTCELDDKGRGKAWCNAWLQWRFRFGTAHRSVSGAIGKGIG